MSKFTKQNISSGYATVDNLNENFSNLETFSDTCLSRDGTSPNAMEATLDMNSNDIINVNKIDANGFTSGGVDILEAMNTIYQNFLAITTNITISSELPTAADGNDGDIWFYCP